MNSRIPIIFNLMDYTYNLIKINNFELSNELPEYIIYISTKKK